MPHEMQRRLGPGAGAGPAAPHARGEARGAPVHRRDREGRPRFFLRAAAELGWFGAVCGAGVVLRAACLPECLRVCGSQRMSSKSEPDD